jgi:hypothetical protein
MNGLKFPGTPPWIPAMELLSPQAFIVIQAIWQVNFCSTGVNATLFQARVRAFAATNSSHVTKEELEKELDRELDKAIPFILDELDKVSTTSSPEATVRKNANQLTMYTK